MMKINSNWQLAFSKMLTGAVANPHAVSNLAMAQWISIQRMMWGGMVPDFDTTDEFTPLQARLENGLTRTAKLFVPATVTPVSSLVVMIHGCMQDSESFDRLTGMSALGRQKGFAVLFLDQEIAANPMQCWNWYAPENMHRLGGEPEVVAKLIQKAQQITGMPAEKTHLAGISAGGAQTALMLHLYPELMASAVIVAGPLPFVATDFPEAMTEMIDGPSAADSLNAGLISASETLGAPPIRRRIPVLIVHGKHDEVVALGNAELQVEAVLELNDLLDNGQADGSVKASRQTRRGKFGSVDVWRDADGMPLAVLIEPDRLAHAWSGGNLDEPFSQAGFDLSRLASDFFKASETEDWSDFSPERLAAAIRG